MTNSTDFDGLTSRAQVARYAALAVLGSTALTALGELGELAGVIDLQAIENGPLEWLYVAVLLGGTLAYLISVVAICLWIYRAHANLREAGREIEYSPGWAVGWYFIPIANLFKPFGAMRELWSESHLSEDSYGGEAPGNLAPWWGAWIIGSILSNVSLRLSLMGDGSNQQIAIILSVAANVFIIVAAWLIYQIVGTITQAQLSNLRVAEVFE